MKRKAVSWVFLTLLVVSTFTFVLNVRQARGDSVVRTPRVDELLIKIYANQTAEFAGLNAGEIDIVDSPLTAEWIDILSGNPDVTLANYSRIEMFQLDLNNNETLPDGSHNPCSDPAFRHALAHLVDRTYLVDVICGGLTLPMYTPVPPALTDYVNLDVDTHPYNMTEARSILNAAGYVDSDFDGLRNDPVTEQNVNLTFYYRTDLAYMTEFSEWYRSQLNWTDLGFTPIPIVFTEALDYVLTNKDFHLYTGGWGWQTRDPDFLYDTYHSSKYGHPDLCVNYVHFDDPEYDDWSSLVKYPPDFETAREAAMKCQEILASEECIGTIPLWCSLLQKAHRKYYGHWAGEEAYWDKPWVGLVNEVGYGLDSWWTFLNCRPADVPTGGRIRWGFRNDIEALNPVSSSSPMDRLVLGKVYDTLLSYSPDNLAEDIPCMAESFEVGTWFNPETGTNCTKLTFNLRDDIYFHDGAGCTAEDVKFTINYIKQFPAASLYSAVADVHHVNTPSPFTVVVYENITSCWTLHQIGGLPVLPRHIWASIEDPSGFAPDPDLIGTGPFEFYSYVPGESIRLLRNPGYMRPRIYVDPPISYVRVGETFSVDVNIDHVADLYGFGFKLGYPMALLNAMDVVVQPFLNEPVNISRREIDESASPEIGFVWVNVTSLSPAEPVSGSGTLATIFFQAIGSGECVLDLYDTMLSDPDGFSVDHSVEGGFYESGMTQVVSTESNLGSYHPSLAVDSDGNVHVAWHDLTDLDCGLDWDILYKKKGVGQGWAPTEVVSIGCNGTSAYPSLAVDSSGNVHIAWHDNTTDLGGSGIDFDIVYRRFEVGVGWGDIEVVSAESTGDSLHPSLAVDSGGNVHVAWHDVTDYAGCGSDADIFYKNRTSSWSPTEVVSTQNPSNRPSLRPSLAVDSGGNVHIAWDDVTNYGGAGSDADVFYRKYAVGVGWGDIEVVSTESTLGSFDASLAVDSGGNVHIAWQDLTDLECGIDSDIFYKRYEVGVDWTPVKVVSNESNADSWFPSLAVDSSRNVHVAWDDRPSFEGSDWAVFYRRYEVVRADWTRTQVVSTESPENSWGASLAVDSSRNVHVVWHDVTDYAGCGSDADILYKYLCLHSTQYPWPMFRHNIRHTGYVENPAPRTNQTQWIYTTGWEVESSPAVADGMVFVGSNDGKVYALDQQTGAHMWNFTTGGPVSSSPAVSDGKIYVGSHDHSVYCLDASTGILVWNYTTGGIVSSSPAVADGKVYVGSDEHKIYCLDAVTGAHVWDYTTEGVIWLCSPAVAYGRVYIGSWNCTVYCLDASTGTPVWSFTSGGLGGSSPAVSDGRIYVGSGAYDNKVYCLDALSGMLIWNFTTGGSTISSPAVAYSKVYVGSVDRRLYCLDAVTGAHVWNFTTDGSVYSSPAVSDGRVYVGSYDDTVYCLDASTGTLVWSYTTGGSVVPSPAVADGMVFVGSDDNAVYAFGSIIRVPEDYPTIQGAIDAADPEDTISIAPGTYNESLVIDKPLTLLGRKGSSTTFAGGGSGIAVNITDTSYVTITNIEITYWDQGIHIDNSSECIIYNNVMYLMSDSGIVVDGENAANNQIYNNVFQDNNIAIDVSESSTGNIIYGNTISQNSIGINVLNSGDNTIYCNSFINNVQQVNIASQPNAWDHGGLGNYWSNYAGTDADGDGIGDSPHVVGDYNQDDYPLMSPYEYWSNAMLGDVNLDAMVNDEDLFWFATAYGSIPGAPNWNPNCDLNKDYKIAVRDLFNLSKKYGETAP